MIGQLYLNQHMTKLSEVKVKIDDMVENINLDTIEITNDGCKKALVALITRYIENFDVSVVVHN